MNCEAHELHRQACGDLRFFGPDEVPPCGGPRDMQRLGRWLCLGCAEALDGIVDIRARVSGE